MPTDEAYKVTLLIATGTAMATGCGPCLNQSIPGLIEAGVADADVRRAVEIGQSVKDEAANNMKEVGWCGPDGRAYHEQLCRGGDAADCRLLRLGPMPATPPGGPSKTSSGGEP